MKKIVSFLIFSALAIVAHAQIYDTLFPYIEDREPTFYYWDTNWYDYHMALHSDDPSIIWEIDGYSWSNCKPEIARYCYTGEGLRVIGVAAALQIMEDREEMNHGRVNIEPEYLRLYEIDSTTNEMVMLASGSWNNTTPHRKIAWQYEDYGSPEWSYWWTNDIYEVYFDKPVMVYDSFYVSATMFNNYYYPGRGSGTTVPVYVIVCGLSAMKTDPSNPNNGNLWKYVCYPDPRHARRRVHLLDEYNVDQFDHFTDTNWHIYLPIYQEQENNVFLGIFPIIDTSYNQHHHSEPCPKPYNLSLSYLSDELCVFSWAGEDAIYWELAVGDPDSQPDNGIVRHCDYNIATVTGLDTGRCYAAWVRTVCNGLNVSEWSDSVHFCVRSGVVGVESELDMRTQVYPNPATNSVSITSPYSMVQVELFSETGKLLNRAKVDGTDISLDISHLEAGSYMLKIYTNNGTTVKKMIKK